MQISGNREGPPDGLPLPGGAQHPRRADEDVVLDPALKALEKDGDVPKG
ncbi:hypothetical protein GCM10019016_083310 [Streptomyces prasinosporus]|uniref:Uncharacterized protein n=1 Tax=Streptomyces prasinosporus TaxID=68256 RepID=A0ABP6U1G4_9ACTN